MALNRMEYAYLLEDGTEGEAYPNMWDRMMYDDAAARNKWPPLAGGNGFNYFTAFLVWHYLTRTQGESRSFEQWASVCSTVQPLNEEGEVEVVDPTQTTPPAEPS